MKNIKLNSILIYDKKEIVAKKVLFEDGVNIITSVQNGKGKTSLSKLILYAFGAKLEISDNWNLNNVYTKVNITKSNKEISIIRYKDTYKILCDNKCFDFFKQSEYNKKLYEILDFGIMIKSKNSNEYLEAIPSILLLPNYISQFAKADERSIFQDLNMYSIGDIRDTFYYHAGVLDNNYSEILKKSSFYEQEISKLDKDFEDTNYIIKYLQKKLDENKNVAFLNDDNIDLDIKKYNNYINHKNELYELMKQLDIIKNNIFLLRKTKKNNDFIRESLLVEDIATCPNCGYDISTFIEKSLKLNLAEENIVNELSNLNADKIELEKSIEKKKVFVSQLEDQVRIIDERRNKETTSNDVLVWKEELNKLKIKYADIISLKSDYEEKLKNYKDSKKSYSEKKIDVDKKYEEEFYKYLKELNITTKRLKELNSELKLNQRFKLEASEMPRLNIASFFAFQKTKKENALYFPLILDFPNMDMTGENILKCFDLMMKNIVDKSRYPQSLIFSINCLERIEKSGHKLSNYNLINLDGNEQLLTKEDYTNHLDEIKLSFTNW